jgi:hypothetical protein
MMAAAEAWQLPARQGYRCFNAVNMDNICPAIKYNLIAAIKSQFSLGGTCAVRKARAVQI